MRWYGSFVTWLLSPAIILPALAVFSDEAYHIDYHHALLGVPQAHATFFHRPAANSKGSLLYSLSERGVLGAINPKDGSVVWRQSLLETESPVAHRGLLRAAAEGNTIFSAIDGCVRAWDAADGRLVWEQSAVGESKDLKVLDVGGTATHLLALNVRATTGFVKKIAADSGNVLWEFEDER